MGSGNNPFIKPEDDSTDQVDAGVDTENAAEPIEVTPEAPVVDAPTEVEANPYAYREVAEGVEARASTPEERAARMKVAEQERAQQN